jgi:nucleoside-diphosphate-sugar epimerase
MHNNMRVLITGGTGFIGSRLALACAAKGYDVVAIGQQNTDAEARNYRVLGEAGIRIVLGSVLDAPMLSANLAGIDVVFHLAAAQHEANVPDKTFWDINVEGTRNLLSACVERRVKRVVHGSTIGVYGAALTGEITEDSPTVPDNIYGVTKLEGEKLVLSFANHLPVIAIRISETYGPGDRRLLKLFRGIKKKMFFLIGPGENLHHLIFIEDLIQGFFAAANSSNGVGQVFLLAGPASVSTNEMVETIATQVGGHVPQMRVPLRPLLIVASMLETICRPMGIQPPLHRRRMDFFKKSFSLSTKKAHAMLGFVPKVSFRDGVATTAQWYKEMGEL